MKKLLGLMAITTVAISGCGGSKSTSDIVLITDAGTIDDQSFNQQAWEAVERFGGGYQQPKEATESILLNEYANAKDQGAELLVLPGFLHADAIAKYSVDNKDMDFIFIDGWDMSDIDNFKNNITAISYETEDAAFLAGYYVSKELEGSGKVAPYGGQVMPSIESFLQGFEAGVKYYNDNNDGSIEVLKPSNPSEGTTFHYTGNFDQGGATALSNTLLDAGADVIFPVAGPQTFDTVAAIKNKSGSTAKVVGVDTDMIDLVADDEKDLIITSVLKQIKNSTQDAIYAWVSKGYRDEWNDTYKGKEIKGGLDDNWVGINTKFIEDSNGNLPSDWEEIYQAAKDYTLPE